MFTEQQLEHIKSVARKKKNQGEISVWRELRLNNLYIEHEPQFDDVQMNIIKYCAEECKRQRSGEISVYDMLVAWTYAYNYGN